MPADCWKGGMDETGLEFNELVFPGLADRTYPGIRYLLERRAWSDSPIRIADFRVVNIITDRALPFIHGPLLVVVNIRGSVSEISGN